MANEIQDKEEDQVGGVQSGAARGLVIGDEEKGPYLR